MAVSWYSLSRCRSSRLVGFHWQDWIELRSHFPWLTPNDWLQDRQLSTFSLNNVVILDGVPTRKKPQIGGICGIEIV
jgi:hypothetical protein